MTKPTQAHPELTVLADPGRFGTDGAPVKVLRGGAIIGRGYRKQGMYYREDAHAPKPHSLRTFARSFLTGAGQ